MLKYQWLEGKGGGMGGEGWNIGVCTKEVRKKKYMRCNVEIILEYQGLQGFIESLQKIIESL